MYVSVMKNAYFLATSLYNQEDSSGISSCCTNSEHLNPTHRAQTFFVPRHDDELLLEVGDAVHVERECEDHWCYGRALGKTLGLYSF